MFRCIRQVLIHDNIQISVVCIDNNMAEIANGYRVIHMNFFRLRACQFQIH